MSNVVLSVLSSSILSVVSSIVLCAVSSIMRSAVFSIVPSIMPGVLSGGIFAFTISFDDVTGTLFWKPGGVETVPLTFSRSTTPGDVRRDVAELARSALEHLLGELPERARVIRALTAEQLEEDRPHRAARLAQVLAANRVEVRRTDTIQACR